MPLNKAIKLSKTEIERQGNAVELTFAKMWHKAVWIEH